MTRPVPATDGLVTRSRGLGLAVLTADCLPILAHDRRNGVIGVAHAGRTGAAAGIALQLLTTMTAVGAEAELVEVVVGPSICGSCYEVPAVLQAEVDHDLPHSACRTRWGTTGLNLQAGVRAQLEAAGARVTLDPTCTLETARLFSHRRGAPTGRQAGLIWMRP